MYNYETDCFKIEFQVNRHHDGCNDDDSDNIRHNTGRRWTSDRPERASISDVLQRSVQDMRMDCGGYQWTERQRM